MLKIHLHCLAHYGIFQISSAQFAFYDPQTMSNVTILSNPAPRAQAIRTLKRWIADGVLTPGMPLPTEQSLSLQLEVPRATVNRAIQVLEREGLIRAGGGRTRIVVDDSQKLHSTLVRRAAVVFAPSLEPSPHHRQSGWTDWITQGIVAELRTRGHNVLTINPGHIGPDEGSALLRDKPLGVIVSEVFHGSSADPAPHLDLLEHLQRNGVPVVVYGGDPRLASFDRVTSDHEQGAYELTRWLVEQGRRRPLLFFESPVNSYWQEQRRLGYERAMREAGLKPRPPRVATQFPVESRGSGKHFEDVARFAAGHLIEELSGEQPADAILALSDGKVFPLARACRLLGKRVHEDVAIVGYDNYYLDSWEREFESCVPLATVEKGNFEMGREMVGLLFDRIEGRLPAGVPQNRVIAPRLIVNAEEQTTDVPVRKTSKQNGQGETK